jgi:hypothetical protein
MDAPAGHGPPVAAADYFAAPPRIHLFGLVGGVIRVTGMMLALLASDTAGDAISYGLSNTAPVVAALWGVFVWREFAAAPPAARGQDCRPDAAPRPGDQSHSSHSLLHSISFYRVCRGVLGAGKPPAW